MDTDEIINRVSNLKKLRKKQDVARLIDLSPSDYSNRYGRGTLLPVILMWGIKDGINLNWLITGEGQPQLSKEETQINPQALSQIIAGVEKALKRLKIKKADPVKKADFIAMCYEFYSQSGREVSEEFIERHLRLVA
jgi:hypothetical protein